MTAAISDPSFGTSRTIGRYFGLVSAVPTALLAAYLILLIASGAWTHRPDFRAGVDALTSMSVGKIVGLLGATLVVALVLHTVQFALVQLLEGYWGGNPKELDDIMPTRLGNLLRRYEVNAGRGYKINILKKATHLALVAPENHVDYLKEQRYGLDLAVRLCASGIIASLATAFLMWPWDVWLLLTAVPYALAYVSYRGALVAATHYGDALAALVDLNRFRMYKELHLPLPDNTIEERDQNDRMDKVIGGAVPNGVPAKIHYEHPATPPTETPTPPEEHPSGG